MQKQWGMHAKRGLLIPSSRILKLKAYGKQRVTELVWELTMEGVLLRRWGWGGWKESKLLQYNTHMNM